VIEEIAAAYAETLGGPLVHGALTARERAAIHAAEGELGRASFLLTGGGRRDTGLKIARGVHVFEGGAPGLDLRVSLRVRDGLIDALAVRGSDARGATALIGQPVAALAASGSRPPVFSDKNPADVVAEVLATQAGP
jgi:hypothetical protein